MGRLKKLAHFHNKGKNMYGRAYSAILPFSYTAVPLGFGIGFGGGYSPWICGGYGYGVFGY